MYIKPIEKNPLPPKKAEKRGKAADKDSFADALGEVLLVDSIDVGKQVDDKKERKGSPQPLSERHAEEKSTEDDSSSSNVDITA